MNTLKQTIQKNVQAAIAEDIGTGDITASLIPAAQMTKAEVISREHGILCGQAWFDEVFAQIDPDVQVEWHKQDGDEINRNNTLCELKGHARSILTGERVALNFLQTLSATATITHDYVKRLEGYACQLLDTRKTIPGLREAQKYAVTCGGGKNHRKGLYDAFLIKENHIIACGSIRKAIEAAKNMQTGKIIEIEVESLQELEEALSAQADIIMLDNFTLDMMNEAVKITAHKAKLEASGNLHQQPLEAIAKTGIDFISLGALTKHITAIDLSMRFHADVC